MTPVEQWGIEVILALQRLSPGLDGIMNFLSFLGREDFFLVLVAFLYWCVDARWGLGALGILLLSDFTNHLFKWTFHAPRPYWIDARVRALSTEASYGIPSGHAQTGLALWGFLAAQVKNPWAWVAAGALVLGISLSRVYLGVHFPHDVAVGWAVGVPLLAVYLWARPRVGAWLKSKSLAVQIAASLACAVVMLGLALAVHAALAGVVDPPDWEAQAAASSPSRAGQRATDPRSLTGLMVVLGTVAGAGIGAALAHRTVLFDARGPWAKRIARLVLGILVLLGLRVGLGAVLPGDPTPLGLALRTARYAVMALWAIWLAPWVFVRIGLARVRAPGQPE